MQLTHSNTLREAASTAAVAGGPLAALAVSVHLSALAPYILAAAALVFAFLQWRKRANAVSLVARLFFFCFTFMLAVMLVYPWPSARLSKA